MSEIKVTFKKSSDPSIWEVWTGKNLWAVVCDDFFLMDETTIRYSEIKKSKQIEATLTLGEVS